jgi:BMFP domain-containing protein YqiC
MATDRPRFFDDIAGVAGGALSAFSGLYDEAEAAIRARLDEAIRKLDLVKREDFEAVQEMAANARAGQEAAEARIAALEIRVAALEGPAAVEDDLPDEEPAAPLIDEL